VSASGAESTSGAPAAATLERRGLEELVTRFCDAFNRDDLDAVMGYFAEDALYETFEGQKCRGKAEIRAAFEPQFRGDFGQIRFLTEDMVVDAAAGKAVLRWRCQHEIAQVRGLPGLTGLRQALYRGLYGRSFGWYGLDVLHFVGGKLVEKRTYAQAKLPLVRRGAPPASGAL
jgi:ketosteroid isomerase-like protein